MGLAHQPSTSLVPENDVTTKLLSQEPRSLHPSRQNSNRVQQPPTPSEPPSSPKEWNRWLVATQIFTAPLLHRAPLLGQHRPYAFHPQPSPTLSLLSHRLPHHLRTPRPDDLTLSRTQIPLPLLLPRLHRLHRLDLNHRQRSRGRPESLRRDPRHQRCHPRTHNLRSGQFPR